MQQWGRQDANPCGSAGFSSWSHLPGDIIAMVEERLTAQAAEGHMAAMRAVCRAWRHALTHSPARLRPLGRPARLAAFPRAVELDYAARGAGQSLTDEELLAAATLLGPHLQRLNIGGAFQLTTPGLKRTLRTLSRLRHLAADGCTLQDAAFAGLAAPGGEAEGSSGCSDSSKSNSSTGTSRSRAATLASAAAPLRRSAQTGAPLQQLESLSLRGCLYLRGGMLADLAAGCPVLATLDLAGCGLALNLNPDAAAQLACIRSLQRLVLDCNGVDDGAMQHVAALPRLRELSLRFNGNITDAALRLLAQRRGSAVLARASADASSSGGGGGGEGGGRQADAGLVSLDISGCSGLTDQCWLAITEMQGLTSLWLEHMAPLLQFPAMPEALPAALWRLPRLRLLSLAGSCCHPSKLKLLAATCGSSITRLDMGTAGSGNCCAACCCHAGGCAAGGPTRWQPAAAAGQPYRRLTSLHERDLCEAAQSFRQLQHFTAAGSGLPLRVCTAFLSAAPEGRLAAVDLSGCCLDAERPAAAAAHASQPPWQQQLFFSSGARRALNFDSYPAVTGTSASRLQQLHAEADSWQRPATAGCFAAALRRQAGSLRSLRLGGASGVTDRHLSSLRALSALTWLCLAGTGTCAVSAALVRDAAAGCPALQVLDMGGTAADDACLAAAAAMPQLRMLGAAGCSSVGPAGIAALPAGPAALSLQHLELSGTSASDAALDALAGGCRQLCSLALTGCRELSPAGIQRLCQLSRLASLSLGRCPNAVTDAGLLQLASSLPQLTRLSLSESAHLTAAGLGAALPLLPVLADLDLTACPGEQLRDDHLLELLRGTANCGGGTAAGCTGALLTPANVQLPQGGSSPTGSPFRRRVGVA